jgi:hypothetical protein
VHRPASPLNARCRGCYAAAAHLTLVPEQLDDVGCVRAHAYSRVILRLVLFDAPALAVAPRSVGQHGGCVLHIALVQPDRQQPASFCAVIAACACGIRRWRRRPHHWSRCFRRRSADLSPAALATDTHLRCRSHLWADLTQLAAVLKDVAPGAAVPSNEVVLLALRWCSGLNATERDWL